MENLGEKRGSPTSLWQGRLELALSDANLPPGESQGQRVNTALVWMRLDGGQWRSTGHRSLHKAVKIAESFVDPEEAFVEMTDEGGGMKEKVNPNLCEKCHAEHGCGESHLFLQADTGICGMCGQVSEVWDCTLLSLYAEMGIEPDDVSRALPRLRYHPHEEPLKMPEVHTIATEFLKQKYSP